MGRSLMMNLIKKNEKGFTLIELIVVIGITAILAVIVSTSSFKYLNHAKETVCQTNRQYLERAFLIAIELEEKDEVNVTFSEFLEKEKTIKCPDAGTFTYLDKHVNCDHHSDSEEEAPIL